MTDQSAEDFAKAQAEEYGTYTATAPIYVEGVLAFLPGQPVPVSHVKQYGYDKQKLVEKNTAADQPAATQKG